MLVAKMVLVAVSYVSISWTAASEDVGWLHSTQFLATCGRMEKKLLISAQSLLGLYGWMASASGAHSSECDYL